jgi:hypothetical protein
MVEVGLLSGKLVINATEKKIYLRNVSHWNSDLWRKHSPTIPQEARDQFHTFKNFAESALNLEDHVHGYELIIYVRGKEICPRSDIPHE